MSLYTTIISTNTSTKSSRNEVSKKTQIPINSLHNKSILPLKKEENTIKQSATKIEDSFKQISHVFKDLSKSLQKLKTIVLISNISFVASLAIVIINDQCNSNPALNNSTLIKIAQTISFIVCGGSLLTSLGIAISC